MGGVGSCSPFPEFGDVDGYPSRRGHEFVVDLPPVSLATALFIFYIVLMPNWSSILGPLEYYHQRLELRAV